MLCILKFVVEGEEERREIRKRKASLLVHKVAVAILSSSNWVAANNAVEIEENSYKSDHRILPRGKRRIFDNTRASKCILADYLGPGSTFNGKEFEMMFRVSTARFERMLFAIKRNNNSFYQHQRGTVGQTRNATVSFEARLLLPLKCLAYGVPPYTFADYFQMSKSMARECIKKFNLVMKEVYAKEYLRLPTRADLKSITKLHKAIHGVDGLFGSLDSMHTVWKNCPVAWQGFFKGKEKSLQYLRSPPMVLSLVIWICRHSE